MDLGWRYVATLMGAHTPGGVSGDAAARDAFGEDGAYDNSKFDAKFAEARRKATTVSRGGLKASTETCEPN